MDPLLCLFFLTLLVSARGWEGRLVFNEDFHGESLRKFIWDTEEGCEGKGYRDVNLECFKKGTNNVQVENGTLVITARPELNKEYMMGVYKQEKMTYTSGKVIQSGFGFTHGTYVVRARMPKGKHLLPSIYLVPMGQGDDKCSYEEIDVVQARGQRPSTLSVGAHYGSSYVSVASKSIEKVFRGKDFGQDFHEFGLKWMPTRLEWYLDGKKIYEASTHFNSDWTTSSGYNVPNKCGESDEKRGLFQQRSMLVISLSVGGYMFPEAKYGTLRKEEAEAWQKPTLEIDWVRVYDSNRKHPNTKGKEKLSLFNIPGIDGLDVIY